MKKRIAIVAAVLALGAGGVAVATSGEDEGCTKVSADGTSSLHVSERAMKLARENDWEATSDDGLVCE